MTILDDTGFQPMSDLAACGISINLTPSVREHLRQLVLQRPRIDRLYEFISAGFCADFPASYMALTFHLPNNVVALAVRRGSA